MDYSALGWMPLDEPHQGLTTGKDSLMRPRLRLFVGDEAGSSYAEPTPAPTVSMSFGELSAVLLDALRTRRRWIDDFEDDEVQVSEDLYDVLVAYSRLRPGA